MSAEEKEEARPTGKLDRVFRAVLIFVPLGVMANLALSWTLTDQEVLRTLFSRGWTYLWIAVALALVPWVTNAIRILVWARFISHKLTLRDAFRITIGAELASSVFPTSSGGEVIRWGMLLQKGITPGQAASIVTLGYLEDLIFFAVALPAAFVYSRAWELPVLSAVADQVQGNALVSLAVIVAVLFGLRVLSRMLLVGRLGEGPRRWGLRRVGGMRKRLRKAMHDFRDVLRLVRERGKTRFALMLGITSVQWICRYSIVTALVAFLGVETQPVLYFLLQWVIFTLMLFVPTPGASGGAEAAFLLIYSAVLPAGVIGVATAGWRLLTFYFQLSLGSLVFVAMNLADARAMRRRTRERAARRARGGEDSWLSS